MDIMSAAVMPGMNSAENISGPGSIGSKGSAVVAEQEAVSGESFKDVLQAGLSGVCESLDDIFADAAAKYGLPLELLKAVAKAESGFSTRAVSGKGAMGIMQLMPATAKGLGVTDPFDARQNIMGGAKFLKENLDTFGGNVSYALAAYNAGPNNVKKYGGIPPFKETQEYVKNILSDLDSNASYLKDSIGKYVFTGSGGGAFGQLFGRLSGLGSFAGSGLSGLYGTGYGSTGSTGILGNLVSLGSAGSLGSLGIFSSLAGLTGTGGAGASGGYGSMTGSGSTGGFNITGLSGILGASFSDMTAAANSLLSGGSSELPEQDRVAFFIESLRWRMAQDAGNVTRDI